MPALPPSPVPQQEPHQHRQVAESFGSQAERYDRARPRYPAALVERIVASSPGPDVLDVGCGTGIAARQFQAAGCRVLGVDPDARMAELARGHGIQVEVATFEAWHPAGRAFDTVTAGQAWHWVDPAAGAAQAARVLRPGGRLAAFWNVFQPPPEVAGAFSAVHRQVMPESVANFWARPGLDAYAGILARVADGMRQTGAFSEPEQWQFDWEQGYTRDEWLDAVPTAGLSSQLPPATLRALLTGTGAAIDALGGSFTMHYATVVVTATRPCAA